MLDSAILEVAIGLVFIFLSFSLLVSAATELSTSRHEPSRWRSSTYCAGRTRRVHAPEPGPTAWTRARMGKPGGTGPRRSRR